MPLYQKTYGSMTDYFALAVNGGKPVKNFANIAAPKKEVVVETTKGTVTMSAAESHSHSDAEDSCGCGKSGGCGCSNKGAEAEGSCGCGGGGSCGC